ncbi:MAG: TatD family hydrolase [Bacteroidales bacterium]
MIQWIDTHTHIYMQPSIQEQEDCMRRTLEAGVHKLILAGVDLDSVKPILDFCKRHSAHAFPSIGLHPTEVKENFKEVLFSLQTSLEENLQGKQGAYCCQADNPIYRAIGEIGMDLYWDKTSLDAQKQAFRLQIQWAKKYDLPLILHIRNAFEEAIAILKEEQNGSLRGVFHCYSGSYEQAVRAINLGFYLGIGGVLTFKNSHLPETVEKIGLEHLVLETDAPFLAPHPYRGKPNESSYLPLIGYKMAEIKHCAPERVSEITNANASTLFKIGE